MQKRTASFIFTLSVFFMIFISIRTAGAIEEKRFVLYGTGNIHGEIRDTWDHGTIYAMNYDFLAGMDFLLLDPVYIGARFGWYAETVCTSFMAPELDIYQKPSLGIHVGYLLASPTPFLTILLGLSGDFLINFDQLHIQQDRWYELIYLFVGVNGDIRFNVTDNLFLGLSIEAGVFPFFQPSWPLFAKAGIQLGVWF